ncbi:hypothetical protein R1flu_002751 [Riccia fluitans]|uniref:Uncharacterized protein n=1 Tax=Riccia fluitans TaxID=41844 RepID=A0ABD1Y7D5_9MARC
MPSWAKGQKSGSGKSHDAAKPPRCEGWIARRASAQTESVGVPVSFPYKRSDPLDPIILSTVLSSPRNQANWENTHRDYEFHAEPE